MTPQQVLVVKYGRVEARFPHGIHVCVRPNVRTVRLAGLWYTGNGLAYNSLRVYGPPANGMARRSRLGRVSFRDVSSRSGCCSSFTVVEFLSVSAQEMWPLVSILTTPLRLLPTTVHWCPVSIRLERPTASQCFRRERELKRYCPQRNTYST